MSEHFGKYITEVDFQVYAPGGQGNASSFTVKIIKSNNPTDIGTTSDFDQSVDPNTVVFQGIPAGYQLYIIM